MQIRFIKQILKRLADFQFLTYRRSETSFSSTFNQNFKETDGHFKISKLSKIEITLMYQNCVNDNMILQMPQREVFFVAYI